MIKIGKQITIYIVVLFKGRLTLWMCAMDDCCCCLP